MLYKMANPALHQAFAYMKQTAPFHTLGFRWPTTRDLPAVVRKLTVQEFMTAIELAAYTVESIKDKSNAAEFKDLLQKEMEKYEERMESHLDMCKAEKEAIGNHHGLEMKYLEEKYTSIVAQQKKQIDELSAILANARLAHDGLKAQMEELRLSSASFFESAIQKATEAKEVSHSREIERLLQSEKESRAALERQSKELLLQIESRYRASEDKLREQLETVQKKESDSSVLIGQRGEKEFEDLVLEHTKWQLTNMSKTAHGTDRSCTVRDCNILFEVKNYSNDVPSEELKKFYRDMEEHNDQHLGVFISMKTPIQTRKQKGYLHIEWTKNSQMLLIFQNFLEHDPKDMLSFIDACVDTALTVYRAHSDTSTSTNLNYQKRIDQAKLYIEKELKRVGDMWKQMKVDKQNFLDMIDRVYNTYKYNLDQAKAALQNCTEILVEGMEKKEESQETIMRVPEIVVEEQKVEGIAMPTEEKQKGRKKSVNKKVKEDNNT